MFEKMYIEGDRKFKKRWFILLLIFNIAAVCVMTVAAYRYKFGTMAAAFLIQFVIFMISVFYVKKYEKDIAGGENYAKTKIYALVFIAVKIGRNSVFLHGQYIGYYNIYTRYCWLYRNGGGAGIYYGKAEKERCGL